MADEVKAVALFLGVLESINVQGGELECGVHCVGGSLGGPQRVGWVGTEEGKSSAHIIEERAVLEFVGPVSVVLSGGPSVESGRPMREVNRLVGAVGRFLTPSGVGRRLGRLVWRVVTGVN